MWLPIIQWRLPMAIAEFTRPLSERIERWISTGSNLTRILLHPEDYVSLSDSKREKIEEQYSLPIEVLGGVVALKRFVGENSKVDIVDTSEDVVFVDPAKELENV
jgi:hypothetical protein